MVVTVEDSIEYIHRRFLDSNLHQQSQEQLTSSKGCSLKNTKKLSTLHALKRKRISLCAEIEEHRKCRIVSLSDDLDVQRQRMQQLQDRPYLRFSSSSSRYSHCHYSSILQFQEKKDASVAIKAPPKVNQMHKIRLGRMLAAAYRLSGGISASLDDDNGDVLTLNLDISVRGTFVACYQVFFQLALVAESASSSPTSEQNQHKQQLLYLRLKQHTVPKALAKELSQTMASSPLLVGPLVDYNDDNTKSARPDHQSSVLFLEELKYRSRLLYQACYAYIVRQQTMEQLQQLDKKRDLKSSLQQQQQTTSEAIISSTSSGSGGSCYFFYVDRATLSDTNLSFRLHVIPTTGDADAHAAGRGDMDDGGTIARTNTTSRAAARSVSLCLHWDSMDAKPNTVTVSYCNPGGGKLAKRRASSRSRRAEEDDDDDDNDDVIVISDEETRDEDLKELSRLATDVFGRLPILQAIERIVAKVVALDR